MAKLQTMRGVPWYNAWEVQEPRPLRMSWRPSIETVNWQMNDIILKSFEIILPTTLLVFLRYSFNESTCPPSLGNCSINGLI